MAAKETIHVPHLGGIDVGYRLSPNFDATKPTAVCLNSMCTTVSLFNPQFEDETLLAAMNLLAIEPLGHGATSLPKDAEHWTYWDSAAMALQAMTALGIEKAVAMGTSQGGWMVARMALLAPGRIMGLILLGTSMDSESVDSRSKGCWDPESMLAPFLEGWSSPVPTPEFAVGDEWCGLVAGVGFGSKVGRDVVNFWERTVAEVYRGDDGRRKVRMALMCLLGRDGLLLRLRDVTCPVYWLQGFDDVPYATTIPFEHIKCFTSASDTKLRIVEGGAHYLNVTSPKEVGETMIDMVKKTASEAA